MLFLIIAQSLPGAKGRTKKFCPPRRAAEKHRYGKSRKGLPVFVESCLAEFAGAPANKFQFIFRRDMCVPKNSLRGGNVRPLGVR